MNSCIPVIENKIGIKNILDGFLVHMDLNSKNGSLTGQFVDCVITYAGLGMKCSFTKMKGLDASQKQHQLFFTLNQFLITHPDIENMLAGIVRNIYGQTVHSSCVGCS